MTEKVKSCLDCSFNKFDSQEDHYCQHPKATTACQNESTRMYDREEPDRYVPKECPLRQEVYLIEIDESAMELPSNEKELDRLKKYIEELCKRWPDDTVREIQSMARAGCFLDVFVVDELVEHFMTNRTWQN